MRRWFTFVLLLAAAAMLVAAGAEPAAAQVAQTATGDEICAAPAPAASSENGFIVVTTVPRWSGVEIVIDGQSRETDSNGCLAVELAQGDHRVEVASIEERKLRQRLGGLVRTVRGQWPQPIVVGEVPVELEVIIDSPVCEYLEPQRVPGALTPAIGENTSLLIISSVPRTEGVLVSINGEDLFTDAEGCLVAELADGVYDIAVPDVYEMNETTRIVFGRWDDLWDIERKLTVGPGDRELDLGVKIQHPVRFDFFDASLEPFDVSRVQSASLVNSFGEAVQLSEHSSEDDEAISFDEVWLSKNRLRRISGGLRSDDNIYVFRDVWVDGLNVVQSGEIDYIPQIDGVCPDLSSFDPQRCSEWRVRLLLFPFQVELRNFIFRQPVTAEIAVYPLNAPADAEPVLSSATSSNGVAIWPQVPRGDYEIRVTGGGLSTRTPTILTGPKVEQITVMTRDVLWFVIPTLILVLATIAYFIKRPRWRLALATIWPLIIGFVLSVPSLGAALNRPLSASVDAVYTASGEFSGIDAYVRNGSPVPVDQTYCAPDFELRIPHSGGIWSATYESPDFHDVEMSRSCRLHRVAPGSSRELFTSTQGQEWTLDGPLPPPGVYEAFIKVFDIPAAAFDIDLRNGLAPFLTFGQGQEQSPEVIPFTNPFED